MATIQNINVSTANDGLGDSLRDSQVKANSNFAELNDKKVEKVAGFGLSENNLTDTYVTILDNINPNAEQNVQTDWNQNDDTQDNYLKNKDVLIAYIDNMLGGVFNLRGAYDASVDLYPETGGSGAGGDVSKGDVWIISVDGTLGVNSVTEGMAILALEDLPLQDDSKWNVFGVGIITGAGATTLPDLTDVTITSPVTNQTLLYNSTTSQWENGDYNPTSEIHIQNEELLSTDLATQDAAGIVDYINALDPSVLINLDKVGIFTCTDTGHNFLLKVNGAYYGVTEAPITTADVLDFGTNSGGAFIPLNGTVTPVTGDIEIKGDAYDIIKIKQSDPVGEFNYSLDFNADAPSFRMYAESFDFAKSSAVELTQGEVKIISGGDIVEISSKAAVSGGRGMSGLQDYSPNITNLDYPQKIYVDGKITQVITNGVTDKTPSEDAVFDALATRDTALGLKAPLASPALTGTPTINGYGIVRCLAKDAVASSAVTGTTSITLMKSYLIPANTLSANDIINIQSFRCDKTGTAGTMTMKLHCNTSASLSGATLLAQYLIGSTNITGKMQRSLTIVGGLMKFFASGVSVPSDATLTTGLSSMSFNPAVDNYIITSMTLTNGADSVIQTEFLMTT